MNASRSLLRVTTYLLALAVLAAAAEGRVAAQPKQQQKQPAKLVFSADELMLPMDHIGPQPRLVLCDDHDIIPTLLDNRLRDVALGQKCVHRHNAAFEDQLA